ncbi:Acyl carrier protein phosphodiesterase [Luteibacter sp. UNC138MFCol5.1]|uniref:acyl carrier protein phosphodiesterase n=1 Tax=Luteibacter sp. UNC138MFCol5.1 TaxID=1502774 RepID=UPI0008BE2238|nr:ACP phosphodiesterase [Luteibacter sp. UNC138MFCol5.1]SEO41432.1 Acyl carrier protein phosphodiesterase [Luteibacter sp. UNC138MFCol5.1]
MNVLAHALLAGDDPALRLGGVMGDFVHGTPDLALPARVRDGIYLHRAIDVFTDSHPAVRAARERMQPPFRRYAGILLDVWFDHLLANDFPSWSDTPLDVFSNGLRAELRAAEAILPDGLKRFLAYMDMHDLPAGYARLDRIEGAFAGISRRLSRANPVADGVPVLLADAEALRGTFAEFFPALRRFAAGWAAERIALTSPDRPST